MEWGENLSRPVALAPQTAAHVAHHRIFLVDVATVTAAGLRGDVGRATSNGDGIDGGSGGDEPW